MEFEIKNARWLSKEKKCFECEVNDKELGWIPFGAHQNDPEKYGRELFSWAVEHCEIAEPDSGKLLEEAKAAALAELNAAVDKAQSANIEYKSVAYQADEKSEKALNDRVLVLQASGKIDTFTTWIAADNSQHKLSFSDLAGLAYAIAERNQKIILEARAKKDAIEKAETPEAVAKIDPALSNTVSSSE